MTPKKVSSRIRSYQIMQASDEHIFSFGHIISSLFVVIIMNIRRNFVSLEDSTMSANKLFLICLVLLMVSGCKTMQGIGIGSQSSTPLPNPTSSSQSSGSMDSKTTTNASATSSQGTGKPAKETGPVPIIYDPSDDYPEEEVFKEPVEERELGTESSSSSQANASAVGKEGSNQASTSSGQSASSIFNESLEVFDREMAAERVVMASSGEGRMSRQASQDAAAVESGRMEEVMQSGDMADGAEMGSSEQDQQEATSEKNVMNKIECKDEEECDEIIPDDIAVLIADGDGGGGIRGEDVIGRQIREAASLENDPLIRDALWDEYRKHMGIK